MHKRTRTLSAAISAGLATFLASAAFAHHPIIEAEAVCDESDQVAIDFTSTSWLTTGDPGSGNTRVDILFNNVLVASGAYAAPTYSFSGSEVVGGAGSTVIVTAVAVDPWDSGEPGGQSASVEVTLPEGPCVQAGLGRFTGGGFQLRVGAARVTRGLTIHCDLLLSNNLEVNFGGKRFHMTEHLTTVECSDNPEYEQAPPPAPIDTLKGVGTGRYNGNDGYTIEFTLIDAGEPGTQDTADRMAILIYQTSNPSNVVLDIPEQDLSGGNLQAHYDQPHK